MIKFRCSHCKKKFGVPDDYAGRRIRCNTCGQHTIVPGLAAQNKSVQQHPQAGHDSSGDQLLTAEDLFRPLTAIPVFDDISQDDKPMELLSEPQDPKMQLQSFHNYQQPASETEDSDPDEPAAKNSISDLIQRSCSNPKTDRIEQTLDFLSYISCIGPVFFILIIIAAGFIASHNNSPRTMRAPFAEPATGPIEGPTSFLAAFPAIRYTFYAFACGISPLALIGSLFLVFRYSYSMSKSLYFSIILHGLIFFNIFSG